MSENEDEYDEDAEVQKLKEQLSEEGEKKRQAETRRKRKGASFSK